LHLLSSSGRRARPVAGKAGWLHCLRSTRSKYRPVVSVHLHHEDSRLWTLLLL
jgi:hypothetical protein